MAHDPLAEMEQLCVVTETDVGLLNLSSDLDVNGVGSIHHDVGDIVARQQRLERTISENVVADILEQFVLFGDGHHDLLGRNDILDDVLDRLARFLSAHLRQLGHVDRFDQCGEDLSLQNRNTARLFAPPADWRGQAE